MKRFNFHLTDGQIAALRAASEVTGLMVAELVRRAIDEYLHSHPEIRMGGQSTNRAEA